MNSATWLLTVLLFMACVVLADFLNHAPVSNRVRVFAIFTALLACLVLGLNAVSL